MAERPWVPTDLPNLGLWIDPADPTIYSSYTPSTTYGPTRTVSPVDLSSFFGSDFVGFYNPYGGSISGSPAPSGGTGAYFLTQVSTGTFYLGVSGALAADLVGLTYVEIKGILCPVTSTTDDGSGNIQIGGTLVGSAAFVAGVDANVRFVYGGGGTIQTLNDKSGNNNHFRSRTAVVGTTTVNGNTALNFANNFAEGLYCTTTGLNDTTTGDHSVFFYANFGSTDGVPFVMASADLLNASQLRRSSSNITLIVGNSLVSGGIYDNIVTGYILDGPDAIAYINYGGFLSTMSPASISTWTSAAAAIEIGSSTYDSNATMTGAVGDIIVYKSALLTSERYLVEGYLAHKWGKTADLPSSHPYKTTAPTTTITGPVAPNITTASTANNLALTTLAIPLTADKTISSWSIVGGADQSKFEISGTTLRWASNGTKNYSSPDDADTNNTYIVTVRATDTDTLTADLTITVTVLANPAPNITTASTFNNSEGSKLAIPLTADKAISSWSLVGGADQSKFEISGTTLRWVSDGTKLYGSPNDSDTNNTYIVTVRATDAYSQTDDLTITVTVLELAFNITLRNPVSGFNIVLSDAEVPTEVLAAAAIIEANDTVSSPTKIKIKSILTATEASDAVTSVTKVKIKSATAYAEGSDSIATLGINKASATANITEGADAISFASVMKLKATSSINEGSDTLAGDGEVGRITGVISSGIDVDSSIEAAHGVSGTIDTPLFYQTFSGFSGLAYTEVVIDGNAEGNVPLDDISGQASITEAADTSASATKVIIHASIGAITGGGVILNASDKSANILVDGNYRAYHEIGSYAFGAIRATEGKTTGKWYFEATCNTPTGSNLALCLANSSASLTSYIGGDTNGCSYFPSGFVAYNGNQAYYATYGGGDVIGAAFDVDAGKVWYSKNGVWQSGDPVTGTGGLSTPGIGVYYPAICMQYSGDDMTVNFGDSSFASTPPAGFTAINAPSSSGLVEASDTLSSQISDRNLAQSALTETNDSLVAASILKIGATVIVTEGNDTPASPTAIKIKGSASVSESSDAISSNASLTIKSNFSATEQNDAVTSTSVQKLKAQGLLAEQNDSLATMGALSLRAQVPEQFEQNDSFSSTSQTIVGVDTTIVEADDLLSSSASIGVYSSTDISEEDDTLNTLAAISLKAQLTVDEFNDATISASKITLSAVSSTEFSDSFSATAVLPNSAQFSSNEENDALVAISLATSGSHLNQIEANDAISSQTTLGIHANSGLFDDPDITVSVARVTIAASLATETGDTSTATAAIKLNASGDLSEGNDALSAPSLLKDVYRSAVAITEASDSLASNSDLIIHSQASLAEGSDSVTATGDLIASARLLRSEANDNVSASSVNKIGGVFSGFENDDITASAEIIISLDANITEISDSSLSNGKVSLKASSNVVEEDDLLLMSSSFTVFAQSDIRELDDNLASVAHNPLNARVTTTENNDGLSSNVKLPNNANFFCLEDNDDRVSIAHNPLAAASDTPEEDDLLYGRYDFGTAYAQANNTEQSDSVSATSKAKISASFAKTEGSDTVSSHLERRLVARSTIQEANDAASIAGKLSLKSNISIVEDSDNPNIQSKLKIVSQSASVEANDHLSVSTKLPLRAVFVKSEEADDFTSSAKLIDKASSNTTADDDILDFACKLKLVVSLGTLEDDDIAAAEGTIDIVALSDISEDSDSLEGQCFILGGEPDKDDILKAYAVIKKLVDAAPIGDDDQDGSIHLAWANEPLPPAKINTRRLRKTINTVAIHAHDFEGTVTIEGTILNDPKEDDWFIIAEEEFELPTATETTYENRLVNTRGRIMMMRAKIDVIRGDVDRVLVL